MTGRAQGVTALAALTLLSCSEPRAPALPPAGISLSTENPDSNAPAIAALLGQTCIEAIADPRAFAAAVQASGWEAEQSPVPGGGTEISLWRLAHGRIIYSAFGAEATGRSVRDCQIGIDGEAAPSLARLRQAVRPIVRHPSLREEEGERSRIVFRWRPGPLEERVLTISPNPVSPGASQGEERPGVTIQVGVTQSDPQPSPAGNENVQEDPDR
ncbi:MAG TPA: hypothetical protein VEW71_07935 [Allosphingosinicella sp.]|nr:hypothetical protein [Allosphingosinicella sp.]